MPEFLRAILSALSPIDWLIVIIYMLLSLAIGIYFTKRASKNRRDRGQVLKRLLPKSSYKKIQN